MDEDQQSAAGQRVFLAGDLAGVGELTRGRDQRLLGEHLRAPIMRKLHVGDQWIDLTFWSTQSRCSCVSGTGKPRATAT
jgi:hypothetical protein